MDRRSFFRLPLAIPAIVATAATAEPRRVFEGRITRVSMVESDPGYRAYCMLRGDGRHVRVFLDGVYQKYAKTADTAEGFVLRIATTPLGNMAHDGERLFEETVYGRVEIVVDDKTHYRQYGKTDAGKILPVARV